MHQQHFDVATLASRRGHFGKSFKQSDLMQRESLQAGDQHCLRRRALSRSFPGRRARFGNHLPNLSPEIELPAVPLAERPFHPTARSVGFGTQVRFARLPFENHAGPPEVIMVKPISNSAGRQKWPAGPLDNLPQGLFAGILLCQHL